MRVFIQRKFSIVLLPAVAVATLSLGGCAVDRQNLTTTGSTAATTAYLIHENNDLADARRFAKERKVALRRDAARGEGEVVETFAELLNEPDPREFSTWMQRNYAQLYADSPDAAQQHQQDLVTRVIALR